MNRKKRRHKLIYNGQRLQIFYSHLDTKKKTAKLEDENEEKISHKNNMKSLINIALETRKIEKKTKKIENTVGKDNIKGFEFPIQRIYEILQENGIKIIDYTGKKYIEGMNGIEIISVEKNEKQEKPIILDSINPLIEVNGIIKIRSKVIILSK